MTNHELELQYASTKNILMEGNESCRIPVPIERCPLEKLTELYKDDSVSVQDRLELSQICSDHIASLAEITWKLPASGSTGKASLKGISLSYDMLDIVRVSPLQWGKYSFAFFFPTFCVPTPSSKAFDCCDQTSPPV